MTVHETRPSTDCLLLDLSESGARLHVTDAESLPKSFLLVLDAGIQKWCRVVRRSGNDVGVKFIKTERSPAFAQEKRSKPRLKVDQSVQAVSVNDNRPPVDCTLVDISQSGGRIRLADPSALPEEFMLVLRDDLRKWCRVMRRIKNEVGVRFIKLPEELRSA